jgi:hypothetical protein
LRHPIRLSLSPLSLPLTLISHAFSFSHRTPLVSTPLSNTYTYPFQALQNTSTTHSRMLHLIIMCSQWSKKGISSLLLCIQDLFWIKTTQSVIKKLFKKIYIYNTTKLYTIVNGMVHPMIVVPYWECLYFYSLNLVTI